MQQNFKHKNENTNFQGTKKLKLRPVYKKSRRRIHLIKLFVNFLDFFQVSKQLTHNCTIRQREQLRILQIYQIPREIKHCLHNKIESKIRNWLQCLLLKPLNNYKNTSDSNEAYIERGLSYKINKQIATKHIKYQIL